MLECKKSELWVDFLQKQKQKTISKFNKEYINNIEQSSFFLMKKDIDCNIKLGKKLESMIMDSIEFPKFERMHEIKQSIY